MDIFMTVAAAFMGKRLEAHPGAAARAWMARTTRLLGMCPLEGKARSTVVESTCRFPGLHDMAVETVIAQLLAVGIFVTAETCACQSQKAALGIGSLEPAQGFFLIFLLVAALAFELEVPTFELVAGFCMIEGFPALWPVYQGIVQAMVIAMTGLTPLVSRGGMEAFVLFNPLG